MSSPSGSIRGQVAFGRMAVADVMWWWSIQVASGAASATSVASVGVLEDVDGVGEALW